MYRYFFLLVLIFLGAGNAWAVPEGALWTACDGGVGIARATLSPALSDACSADSKVVKSTLTACGIAAAQPCALFRPANYGFTDTTGTYEYDVACPIDGFSGQGGAW